MKNKTFLAVIAILTAVMFSAVKGYSTPETQSATVVGGTEETLTFQGGSNYDSFKLKGSVPDGSGWTILNVSVSGASGWTPNHNSSSAWATAPYPDGDPAKAVNLFTVAISGDIVKGSGGSGGEIPTYKVIGEITGGLEIEGPEFVICGQTAPYTAKMGGTLVDCDWTVTPLAGGSSVASASAANAYNFSIDEPDKYEVEATKVGGGPQDTAELTVIGVKSVSAGGVTSTTNAPGTEQTLYTAKGESGSTITVTAQPKPTSEWPEGQPIWTSATVNASDRSKAAFPTDQASTATYGTSVTAGCGTSNKTMKICVVSLEDLTVSPSPIGVGDEAQATATILPTGRAVKYSVELSGLMEAQIDTNGKITACDTGGTIIVKAEDETVAEAYKAVSLDILKVNFLQAYSRIMVNGSVFFHAGGLPIKDEYEYKWTASGFGDSESLEPETLSLKFSCSQPTAEGSTGKIEVEYGNVTNAEYPNIGISKVDRAWHEGTTSYVQESGTFTLTSTSTYDLFSQLIDYHLYDQDDFAIRYCEKGGSMPMQAEFFGTLSGYYVIKQAITAEIYEQEGKWHDDPLGYFIDSIRLTGVPPETFKDMYDNFDPNIKEGGEAFCLTEHEWKGSVDENFIKTMTDNDWSGIFVDVVVEQQGKSDIVKSFKVRSTYTITYK